MSNLKKETEDREKLKNDKHLLLILDNPMTSGLYPFALNDGAVLNGSLKGKGGNLALRGAGVTNNMVTVANAGGKVTVTCNEGSVMVNGDKVEGSVEIHHNDRILIAENNFFRYVDPAVRAQKSEDEQVADDVKFSYEFLKEESQKHEKAKQEKEREAERAKLEAKFKAEQAALEAEAQKNILALQAKLEAMETSATDSDEIDRKKAELIAEQERLKAKQEEMKKQQAKELEKKTIESEVIAYELRDAIGGTRQVSQWAYELGLAIRCEAILIHDAIEQKMKVVVMKTQTNEKDGTMTQNMMDLTQFQMKFGEFSEIFTQATADLESGKDYTFPPGHPYQVDPSEYQRIGNVSAIAEPLYHMMDIRDYDKDDPSSDPTVKDNNFKIFSYINGHQAGFIELDVVPKWPTEAEGFDVEEYLEMKEIADEIKAAEKTKDHIFYDRDYLDLEITINKLYSLPQKHASDVRVDIVFPQFISSLCLEDMKERCKLSGEDYDEAIDEKSDGRYGATYSTKTDLKKEGLCDINPVINQTKTIRIFEPFRKKTMDWFKDGSLILAVNGRTPLTTLNGKKIGNGSRKNTALTLKADGQAKQARADRKASVLPGGKSSNSGGGSGNASMRAAAPSAFEKGAVKNLENQVREKESMLSDQGEQIRKLQAENNKLKKNLKDAEAANKKLKAEGGKSSACSIM